MLLWLLLQHQSLQQPFGRFYLFLYFWITGQPKKGGQVRGNNHMN
jgi:hypothetical protein